MLWKLVRAGETGALRGSVAREYWHVQSSFRTVQRKRWKDFTRDLRRAVSNRVRETGLPSLGHGTPFILTQNWREAEKGT